MSELEYVGKINPQPFISLRKEEDMRVEEIKQRISKQKSKQMFTKEQKSESELTYERDAQKNY